VSDNRVFTSVMSPRTVTIVTEIRLLFLTSRTAFGRSLNSAADQLCLCLPTGGPRGARCGARLAFGRRRWQRRLIL